MKKERIYANENDSITILSRIKHVQAKKYSFLKEKAPKIFIDNFDKEINYLWAQYKNGKRYLKDIEDTVDIPEYDDLYEDITNTMSDEEKKNLAIKHMGEKLVEENWEKEGECIHCGNKYILKDSKVVKSKLSDNREYILCPYDKCDGSFLDFVITKGVDNEKNNNN